MIDIQFDACVNIVGAMFRRAFIDYYNNADIKYKDKKELTGKQKEEIIAQNDARHFLDVKKGEPYMTAFGLNLAVIKKRFEKEMLTQKGMVKKLWGT